MPYLNAPTHQAVIKSNNKCMILEELWKNSPISRTNLAKSTGLNKATITNLINELSAEGYIAEVGQQSSRIGRASNLIMFNDKIGVCCGINISSVKISVILCDVYARILWRSDFDFDDSFQPQPLLERVASEIESGVASLPPGTCSKLLGIGVGLPSLVKRESGIMYGTPSLQWENLPIKDFFFQRFRVPVYTDTISNNSVIGEKWFGAARDYSNVIYLSIGRGIGAGILIRGELYSGAEGYAGDVSHMVIDPDGPLCPCGKRGCWEVLGTSYTLGRGEIQNLTLQAEAHDPKAIELLGEIGRNIGIGVANLVHVLNPNLVLIGGSMARAGKWILNPCINEMKAELWPYVFESTTVRFSELKEDSGVIGSATRVIEHIFISEI